MRVGVEMFGAQSPDSRGRGIGRYTNELVRALVAEGRHHYVLYFVEGLPVDDHWRGGGYDIRLRPWNLGTVPLAELFADLVRLNPDGLDTYLVTSPMESALGYAPPRQPLLGPKLAAVVYDLIPLIFQERYLIDPGITRRYYRALSCLAGYQRLLCISEATRQDVLRCCRVAPEAVRAILSASDPDFFRPAVTLKPDVVEQHALRRLGIKRPFLFQVSGTDGRKNHEGLLAAYAALPTELRKAHQVVITCKLTEQEEQGLRRRVRLLGLDSEVVLTNQVPDEVLRLLYQRCALFAFPSLYEGFGLPILEAMLCGAPVLAGDNSSQVELVRGAGLLVSPHDPGQMARCIEGVLTDPAVARRLRRQSLEQAARYSWARTARLLTDSLEDLPQKPPQLQSRSARQVPPPDQRPPLAYFSPFPPKQSGISEYSIRLIEELRRHYRIDLYHESGYVPEVGLRRAEFGCYDYRVYKRRSRVLNYHATLYHMGNSSYHRFIYDMLLEHPGIVVLHDFFLGGFHCWYANQSWAWPHHVADELLHEQGDLPRWFREGWDGDPHKLRDRGIWLNRRIFTASQGVILHDPWCLSRVTDPNHLRTTAVIPMGANVRTTTAAQRQTLRDKFGLPAEALVAASFGIVHPSKLTLEALEAFARLAAVDDSAVFLLVGRHLDDGVARQAVESWGLGSRVRVFDHVGSEDFEDLMALSDIALNLRCPPSNGETSMALLQLLGCGVPTIVTDVGTFGSYPDDVVLKVPYDGTVVEGLSRALLGLARDPERRAAMSASALRHVTQKHRWADVAAQYAAFIDRFGSGRSGLPGGGPARVREAG